MFESAAQDDDFDPGTNTPHASHSSDDERRDDEDVNEPTPERPISRVIDIFPLGAVLTSKPTMLACEVVSR